MKFKYQFQDMSPVESNLKTCYKCQITHKLFKSKSYNIINKPKIFIFI